MRRSIAVLFTTGLLLIGSLGFATGAAAATIGTTTTCSNGVDNTAGLGLICEVTVVNTITASGGSATVTVRECHGAANDEAAACTTTTDVLTRPGHDGQSMQRLHERRGRNAPVQRPCHEQLHRYQPRRVGCHGQPVRRLGRRHREQLRPIPSHHDGSGDHPVQRIRQRGTLVELEVHGHRQGVGGPPRHDQPVQRLDKWRWSPRHLFLQDREQPGWRRPHADGRTDDPGNRHVRSIQRERVGVDAGRPGGNGPRGARSRGGSRLVAQDPRPLTEGAGVHPGRHGHFCDPPVTGAR